jgi:thiamine kinase-like enzyme
MTPEDEAVVAAAVPQVPQLASYEAGQLEISRLGGLTNLVYRVSPPGGGEALCLRCPGEGTAAYIDRAAECANASAAARAGVGPEVLHFADDGVMLMPLLPGDTLSPALFGSKPGAPSRAGVALKQLHASGETFPSSFSLFEQIDKYLSELGEDAKLPDGYHDVLASAQDVRAALAAHPLPSAPCHCDPLSENFIDDGTRAWIVDFEYGGMNDPMWDLGDLIIEASLSVRSNSTV